jgi:chromosome segregation ATPase
VLTPFPPPRRYKSLLAQSDGSALQLTDGSPNPNPNNPTPDSTLTIELRNKVNAKQLEVDRLTETATRLKDYEATLSGNLERVREELSKERMDKAQQKADAAHYKDKVDRMTRLVADNEKEAKRASEQMLKLQNR